MVALGVVPAMIDEAAAAAMCALAVTRFRVLCPIPGLRVGRRTLRPLELVKKWIVGYWAEATGYSLKDSIGDADATDNEDWAELLPCAAPRHEEGGRHGIAH